MMRRVRPFPFACVFEVVIFRRESEQLAVRFGEQGFKLLFARIFFAALGWAQRLPLSVARLSGAFKVSSVWSSLFFFGISCILRLVPYLILERLGEACRPDPSGI